MKKRKRNADVDIAIENVIVKLCEEITETDDGLVYSLEGTVNALARLVQAYKGTF